MKPRCVHVPRRPASKALPVRLLHMLFVFCSTSLMMAIAVFAFLLVLLLKSIPPTPTLCLTPTPRELEPPTQDVAEDPLHALSRICGFLASNTARARQRAELRVTPPLTAVKPYLGAVCVDLARIDKVVANRTQKGEGERKNTDEILNFNADAGDETDAHNESSLVHPHQAIHQDPLPPPPSQFPTPRSPSPAHEVTSTSTPAPTPVSPSAPRAHNRSSLDMLAPPNYPQTQLIRSSMAAYPFVSSSQEAQGGDALLSRGPMYMMHVPHTFMQTSPTPAAEQPPVLCPKCGKSYLRRQEVERHLMSCHLPDWIGCPHRHCSWRGDRMEEFKKHLLKTHSCNLSALEKKQYEIYDRDYILHFILDQRQSVDKVAGYALNFVGERTRELGKGERLNDLWGRPGKGARCLNATASTTMSLRGA